MTLLLENELKASNQTLENFINLNQHEIYMCGPAPFMAAATSELNKLGVAEYQIHKEVFALDLGAVSVQTQAKVQFSGEKCPKFSVSAICS